MPEEWRTYFQKLPTDGSAERIAFDHSRSFRPARQEFASCPAGFRRGRQHRARKEAGGSAALDPGLPHAWPSGRPARPSGSVGAHCA
ncbi:hypothetical protein ACW4FQ_31740, partial [Escherichia coli]